MLLLYGVVECQQEIIMLLYFVIGLVLISWRLLPIKVIFLPAPGA